MKSSTRNTPSDNLSYESLVDAYYAELFSFAHTLTNDSQRAADLVYDSFVLYIRNQDKISDESQVIKWLYTVMFRVHTYLKLTESNDETASFTEDHIDPMTRGKNTLVLECLSRLDEKYRAPLMLHYSRSFSDEKIAEIIGASLEDTKRHLAEGKELFKEIYDERKKKLMVDKIEYELLVA